MFDKLVLAINKHMETGMAMELSLVNKFTLGADESSSTLYTSKLIKYIYNLKTYKTIFIKYVNPKANNLC